MILVNLPLLEIKNSKFVIFSLHELHQAINSRGLNTWYFGNWMFCLYAKARFPNFVFKKIKSVLYSLYYAKACNEFAHEVLQ